MKTFEVTVKDDFLGKELTGTFEADTTEEAEQIAREDFAIDLDTFEENVNIVSIVEVA